MIKLDDIRNIGKFDISNCNILKLLIHVYYL